MKYSAIIFDLGGVLLPIDFAKAYRHFRKYGIINTESFFNNTTQPGFFQEFEKGLLSEKEFIEEIKKHTHPWVTNERIISAFNKIILDFPKKHFRLLLELSKLYKIYLISNTNVIHYKYFTHKFYSKFRTNFEDLFDDIFLSFNYKLRKPEKEFFLLVLNKHSLDPGEVIFFDDDKNNIRVAENIGITSIHISSSYPLTVAIKEKVLQNS